MKKAALILQGLILAICVCAPIWPAELTLKGARTVTGAEEDMGSVLISFILLAVLVAVSAHAMIRTVGLMRRIARDEVPPSLLPVRPFWRVVYIFPVSLLFSFGVGAYGRVIERARCAEAQTMASQIEQSQERHRRRYGTYVTDASRLDELDISFAGRAPAFGMRNFLLSVDPGSGRCEPGYRLVFERCSDATSGACDPHAARPHPLYGAYRAVYDRCSDRLTYENCPRCSTDFF